MGRSLRVIGFSAFRLFGARSSAIDLFSGDVDETTYFDALETGIGGLALRSGQEVADRFGVVVFTAQPNETGCASDIETGARNRIRELPTIDDRVADMSGFHASYIPQSTSARSRRAGLRPMRDCDGRRFAYTDVFRE